MITERQLVLPCPSVVASRAMVVEAIAKGHRDVVLLEIFAAPVRCSLRRIGAR